MIAPLSSLKDGDGLMFKSQRDDRPLPPADSWIAATALHWQIPPVIHDSREFVDGAALTFTTEAPPER